MGIEKMTISGDLQSMDEVIFILLEKKPNNLFLQMLKSIALLLRTFQENYYQFHHRDLHSRKYNV